LRRNSTEGIAPNNMKTRSKMKTRSLISKQDNQGLNVKTNIKAADEALTTNYSQALVCEAKKGVRVKTNLKAGVKGEALPYKI
jgi:hypothetical protein